MAPAPKMMEFPPCCTHTWITWMAHIHTRVSMEKIDTRQRGGQVFNLPDKCLKFRLNTDLNLLRLKC